MHGGGIQKYKVRRLNGGTKHPGAQQDKSKIDGGYRSYAEWQKLTPKQRS
jgi:hypothetical protein